MHCVDKAVVVARAVQYKVQVVLLTDVDIVEARTAYYVSYVYSTVHSTV
jgi:hypothetical protein